VLMRLDLPARFLRYLSESRVVCGEFADNGKPSRTSTIILKVVERARFFASTSITEGGLGDREREREEKVENIRRG
jgi:hypothetical protein